MPTDPGADPTSNGPGSSDNRLLIEILSWDWALHVGMAPGAMPAEHRYQGGLIHSRGLDITGQVITPDVSQGQTVRIWIAPFAPDLDFGPDGLSDVGQCHPGNQRRGTAFEVSLMLPQDALPAAITCLSTIWKYLHLWTTEPPPHEARVTDFAFSRQND